MILLFIFFIMKLELKKVNESFYRIRCDKSISQELIDYFSFYANGYKYMPAYRNRIWDECKGYFSSVNTRDTR